MISRPTLTGAEGYAGSLQGLASQASDLKPQVSCLADEWLFSRSSLSGSRLGRRRRGIGDPTAAAVITIAAAEAAVRRGIGIGRRVAGGVTTMAAEDGEADIGASNPHGRGNDGDQRGLETFSWHGKFRGPWGGPLAGPN